MGENSSCSDKISLQHYNKVTTRLVVTRTTPVVTLYSSLGIYFARKSPILHEKLLCNTEDDPKDVYRTTGIPQRTRI